MRWIFLIIWSRLGSFQPMWFHLGSLIYVWSLFRLSGGWLLWGDFSCFWWLAGALLDDGGLLRHISSFMKQVFACSHGSGTKRGSGNMQGLLRSTLGTDATSLLPCSVGQDKSWGQARFKVWGNELCLMMGMSCRVTLPGVWILGGVENWGHFIIILILHKSLHLSESVS